LSELRSYFESKKMLNRLLWRNPEEVKEAVAVAKTLYASRRLSTQEYTFYALLPLEDYHIELMYHELAPINEKLNVIRKQHGLREDEDWLPGEGPKEYIKLNKQWEDASDRRFIELLREFGLDDLADLKLENSDRLDELRERGRRAVFHRNEQLSAIRDIVVRYEKDARHAADVAAYSAAVTSLGAAIEGLLILRCLKSLAKAIRIAGVLPKRIRPSSHQVGDPISWHFETLIEVCHQAGWLPQFKMDTVRFDSAALAHLIRLLRNNLHPGRHFRERPWSEIDERDFKDAEAIYIILFKTLGKTLQQKKKRT
ncbi:MAG: hypothetical protein JW976_08540, partial [Syntrophaceae bacterium]|nr:hypothetical protein [Syntrophaceae bacterium]